MGSEDSVIPRSGFMRLVLSQGISVILLAVLATTLLVPSQVEPEPMKLIKTLPIGAGPGCIEVVQ